MVVAPDVPLSGLHRLDIADFDPASIAKDRRIGFLPEIPAT